MKQNTALLVVFFLLPVVLFLFPIKYQARQKNKELMELSLAIHEEKANIRLLEIDFSHRTRPQLMRQRLTLVPHLRPTHPNQVIILKE